MTTKILLFLYIAIILNIIILNILLIDNVDNDIIYYILFSDNILLQKYRDYFPKCNYISVKFDKIIFIIAYILYIPIILLFILYKHFKNINIHYYYHKYLRKNILNDINLYIKHPLLLSKGMAYNAILPYMLNKNINKCSPKFTYDTFNKLYWFKFFNKLNIKTPIIIGTINNGKIVYFNKYPHNLNQQYIIKKVYGCCGNGIDFFNKNNIPKTGYYIIQEYICNLDKELNHKTFRIITNYYKNKISAIEIFTLSNNSSNGIITTNISTGGQLSIINNIDNINIKNAINQSIKAHYKINKLYNCNTIGWDIIITNNIYFLEGNIGVSINKKEYIKYVNHYYNSFIKI